MITAQTSTAPSRARRGIRATAALIAAGALALAGCSGGGGSSPSGSGGELKEMTVVTFLPLESFSFTPEMFAYSGGYFEKNGLDVDLQPVQGTAAAIQSLVGGATTITRASTVDVFPAMESGQPITAVGTMAYRSNLRVVSTTDDPIVDPDDMSGKTIGMGSIGGTSEKMLNLALDEAGVDQDSVTRQAVPVTAATLEVVRQKQLAGYIVSLDTSLAIEQQNDDAVIEQVGLVDQPDIQTWITTQSNLDNPERVEEIELFLTAIKEATQFVIDDAENDFDNVLQIMRDSGDWNFPALQDDDVARAALAEYVTGTWVDPDGSVSLLENDMDAWADTYEVYTKAGFVEGGQDPLQWITNDYLPAG